MSTPRPDDLLAALDPDQRPVAEAVGQPTVVLAAAGSGKTRAITHRVAYGVLTGRLREDRVLPVAFTNRAAAEMTGRLRTLGVAVRARTFHAAALAQVRHFWPQAAGGRPPALLAAKRPRLQQALADTGLPVTAEDLRVVGAAIEHAKAAQVAAVDFAEVLGERLAVPGWSGTDLAAGYAAYEAAKDAAGEMDFDDCLLLAIALLEEERSVREAVRDRYRSFVVDEYQDVNPLQQRLLDLWVGDRSDLCVVGDVAQTIYSFAGATPDYLQRFTRRHPAAVTVRLDRDYRSTPQVVEVANRLLAGTGSHRLRAQQPPGPRVEFVAAPDDRAEAEGVAVAVADWLAQGVAPAEAAVLVRVNAQVPALLEALLAAGVPAVTNPAERWFTEPSVKRALVRLRGARAADPSTPAVVATTEALHAEGWAAGGGPHPLDALLALAHRLGADATVSGLVADLTERQELAAPPLPDAVIVTTLHAAKGREWEAVALPGLVEGLLPVAQAREPERIEEERRLLYVGITRARSRLRLSWNAGRARSRFVADLLD